jgi:1-acyl-sn-glycerol-3-phosphate acyltransferase
MTASMLPTADVLPVQRRATFAFRLARAVVGPVFHLVFRIRVDGLSNVPRDRPYIAIANHLNWPDPWLLLLTLPTEPRVHFLANPENLIKHRLHWFVVRQVGGYIPVDLKHHQGIELFDHVDRCLERGGALGIFPEAAYGPVEGELQATWKKGFAHFAVRSGTPIVPVAISGTKDLWLRKSIRLRIGEPIPTGGADVDAMQALARETLQELLPEYIEPRGRKPLRRFLTRLLY